MFALSGLTLLRKKEVEPPVTHSLAGLLSTTSTTTVIKGHGKMIPTISKQQNKQTTATMAFTYGFIPTRSFAPFSRCVLAALLCKWFPLTVYSEAGK